MQNESLGGVMEVHVTKLVTLVILTHGSWRTMSEGRLIH